MVLKNFSTTLGLIFVLLSLIAGGIRLLVIWASAKLAYAAGTELSTEIFRRTLYQPYLVHISRNTSHIVSTLTNKISLVIVSISYILIFIVSAIMTVFLMGTLFLISGKTFLFLALVLSGIYLCIILANSSILRKNSKIISTEQNSVVQILNEALGGIRDILLDGTQTLYCQLYSQSEKKLRMANASLVIVGHCPRYLIESFGIVLFAGLAIYLVQPPSNLLAALPTLGVLILGMQRLIPALQQGYNSAVIIWGYKDAFDDVVSLLRQQTLSFFWEKKQRMPFNKKIIFKSVGFRYKKKNPWVLKNVNFEIQKGSKVGLIGKTGTGKSTCLDLLMAFLQPSEGKILVDNQILNRKTMRTWQRNIAHVPQHIFLSDGSVAENIAFGVNKEKIDMKLVKKAAHLAEIGNFIEKSPSGYNTFVGERGIRLSGGQRQRIGIARALYKESKVLILDEATNALDLETEKRVLRNIDSLKKDITIFMVTHRLSSLKNCDKIINLEKIKS